MKKIVFVLLLFFSCIILKAQTRPVDSLFIWVKFNKEKVVLVIPESYLTVRYQPNKLPKHVAVNQIPIFVPPLPEKDQLLGLLKNELISNNNPATVISQLNYISVVALLLFYSNNDLNIVSEDALKKLNDLNNKSSVRSEASLVVKWIGMIKK